MTMVRVDGSRLLVLMVVYCSGSYSR